jgi:DNA-binding transcriptional LysR family regulator
MKLTQLDGLVAFVTVARCRSFTAAAAALEVTPPAVSQALKQLEARLGVRLVHRTTRSVGLSAAGERYFARVAPAVSELLEAAQELDSYRTGLAGLLRLNAPHVVHQMLLRRAVASFLSAHPGVRIELALDDGFVDIAAAGYDAGVRLGESVQRDMVAVPLTARERMGLVASPAYAKRRGLPTSIEALREHECVRFRFKSSGAIYRWELLRNRRRVEVEVDGAITVGDSLGSASAALDGLGIAYVFERQVAADLAAGRLLPVLPNAWLTQPGLHFYYPSRRQVSPVLKAFIAHCVEEARR